MGGASRERGSEQRGTLGGGAVQGFEGEPTLPRENNGKLHVICLRTASCTCTCTPVQNIQPRTLLGFRSLKLLRITISPINAIIILGSKSMSRVILSMLGMLVLIIQLHLKKIRHFSLFTMGMLLAKFIQPTSQSKKQSAFQLLVVLLF